MNCKRRAGYSLVEVCLALLVAGLGIMAVFALFPEGLGQSRKSVEATEIGAFADYVFAGLTARAWTNNPAGWNNFQIGQLNRAHYFDSSDQTVIRIPANYSKFWWKPFWFGNSVSAYIANYRVAYFTYCLRVQNVTANLKGARLEVWAGDIPTPPVMPGKVFYREFAPIR